MQEEVEWVAIVGIIFSNITFIAMLVVWASLRRRRIDAQKEVQSKLIERFGSSAELVEFLKTPTGRDFVSGVQKGTFREASERSLAGIRKAVVLSFLGLGLLAVYGVSDAEWGSWFALIFLALGLGYLAAAFLSMRLTRSAVSEMSNDVPRS
jgi:hypothetical protein